MLRDLSNELDINISDYHDEKNEIYYKIYKHIGYWVDICHYISSILKSRSLLCQNIQERHIFKRLDDDIYNIHYKILNPRLLYDGDIYEIKEHCLEIIYSISFILFETKTTLYNFNDEVYNIIKDKIRSSLIRTFDSINYNT